MEPSSIPLELISYRGLLKSFEDIARGNFMNRRNNEDNKENKNVFFAIKNLFVYSVLCSMNAVENALFLIMNLYDTYVYLNLKEKLPALVRMMPRCVSFRNNKTILIINSNIITLLRSMLFIPIVWFLKYNYSVSACLTVILHAFFAHFDGIVARVHGVLYPNQDDPLRNRFLIAFCNKVVNLLILIAMLQTINFQNSSFYETLFFCGIIYGVIVYDVVTAVIRVQNYFEASLFKDKSKMANKATLEWKLKTKLQSVGIAALCLAIDRTNENPVMNMWGGFGLAFLILSIRMAHKTLESELKFLNEDGSKKLLNVKSAENLLHLTDDKKAEKNKLRKKIRSISLEPIEENEQLNVEIQNSLIGLDENSDFIEGTFEKKVLFSNDDIDHDEEISKLDEKILENRVDKVYTIGCFDLFHFGHIRLIERMREVGKKVIIGVHDSRSIYKLKNRVPVDSTEKRMLNVKQYADEVFCIAGTDPSNFMKCIVALNDNESAVYIRGDDMPNFPSREVVEKLMPIRLLPYTQGVSSTKLRKEKFSHILAHDEEYLEQNC